MNNEFKTYTDDNNIFKDLKKRGKKHITRKSKRRYSDDAKNSLLSGSVGVEQCNAKKSAEKENFTKSKFPYILRCDGCMKIHFPGTSRFCRWFVLKQKQKKHMITTENTENLSINNETLLLIKKHIEHLKLGSKKEMSRLRGGAGNDAADLLITVAIENAGKHGIKLSPGLRNKADGNCAFDAVLNNINQKTQNVI